MLVSPVSIFTPLSLFLFLSLSRLHSASVSAPSPPSVQASKEKYQKRRVGRLKVGLSTDVRFLPDRAGFGGGFRLQVWINKLLRALTRTSWSCLRSCFCSQTLVVGFFLPLLCLAQYVNTRLEIVDSSQSPEIISLTSGVQ